MIGLHSASSSFCLPSIASLVALALPSSHFRASPTALSTAALSLKREIPRNYGSYAFGLAGLGGATYYALQSNIAFAGDKPNDEVKMTYRRLGNTGIRVSSLSFGSWITFGNQTGVNDAETIMKVAYEAGINFFDNAEAYMTGEAEAVMGNVIKKLGWKRNTYVISTKVFWGGNFVNDVGLSRKHIIEGLNASLKRLQLDYVDVVFCHRYDPHTTVEEVVRAMNHVINQGKAFYWGTSEWTAEEIREAHGVADRLGLIGPTVEQPQCNMLHRDRVEREYAALFNEKKMGSTIWSPLASGVLTGKYLKEIPADSRFANSKGSWLALEFKRGERNGKWEDIVEIVTKLEAVAAKLNCTLAQLALAWCLLNPNVSTVITGASKVSQVKENVKALNVLPLLTPSVVEEIESILKNKPPKAKDRTGRS